METTNAINYGQGCSLLSRQGQINSELYHSLTEAFTVLNANNRNKKRLQKFSDTRWSQHDAFGLRNCSSWAFRGIGCVLIKHIQYMECPLVTPLGL